MRTLQEVKDCPKDILVPTDIAPLLNCKAYNINVAAKQDPALLGFPVIVMGSRVRIPKAGFIRFMEGLQPGEEAAV